MSSCGTVLTGTLRPVCLTPIRFHPHNLIRFQLTTFTSSHVVRLGGSANLSNGWVLPTEGSKHTPGFFTQLGHLGHVSHFSDLKFDNNNHETMKMI